MRPMFKMLASCALALAAVSLSSCQSSGEAVSGSVFQRPRTNAEEDLVKRADKIISRMTLEEKAGQLNQQFVLGSTAAIEKQIRSGEVGAILFVSDPKILNRLQKIAVEDSRTKIPLLVGFDVMHGFRTIFPTSLGQSASFDPAIVELAQAVAAREARSVGIHWTFAPMLDVARDARWGRMVEGPGEDPFLASALARAQVIGFQGERLGAPDHIISGPKHFMGYGAAPGGRDYESVQISDSDIYNVYLPPFEAAVRAGAGNIMSAYMDLNDIPAAANRGLLTDILRHELGFKGWVVSDANGVANLVTQHFARDLPDAAQRALTAGNDMSMGLGAAHFASLPAAVREGRLAESVLDQAVRRVLLAKLKMGLFETPYVDEERAQRVLTDESHLNLAQISAEKSFVLLKNDGVLPLRDTDYKRVAIIGPLANSLDDTLGPWVFNDDPARTVSLFQGVRDRLGAGAVVETAPGIQLRRTFPSPFDAFTGGPPKAWTDDQSAAEFSKALDLANSSDLIILALGETAEMSGERASRSDLALSEGQLRLFDAAQKTGKPLVVVLINGRPLDLSGIIDQAPAILEAWHPGTRGGTALARTLFGDVSPGGKIPVTWPRSAGQLPIFYAHNRSHGPNDQSTRYLDKPSSPLFEFGYGLSYTTFSISAPKLNAPSLAPGGRIIVSASVTNTGQRAGDEVVQLYVHQRSGRASRPVRELKGFERVTLSPGESREVSFELTEDSVKYWNSAERTWVIDPGAFDVWVGASSATTTGTVFEVTGPARVASEPPRR